MNQDEGPLDLSKKQYSTQSLPDLVPCLPPHDPHPVPEPPPEGELTMEEADAVTEEEPICSDVLSLHGASGGAVRWLGRGAAKARTARRGLS